MNAFAPAAGAILRARFMHAALPAGLLVPILGQALFQSPMALGDARRRFGEPPGGDLRFRIDQHGEVDFTIQFFPEGRADHVYVMSQVPDHLDQPRFLSRESRRHGTVHVDWSVRLRSGRWPHDGPKGTLARVLSYYGQVPVEKLTASERASLESVKGFAAYQLVSLVGIRRCWFITPNGVKVEDDVRDSAGQGRYAYVITSAERSRLKGLSAVAIMAAALRSAMTPDANSPRRWGGNIPARWTIVLYEPVARQPMPNHVTLPKEIGIETIIKVHWDPE